MAQAKVLNIASIDQFGLSLGKLSIAAAETAQMAQQMTATTLEALSNTRTRVRRQIGALNEEIDTLTKGYGKSGNKDRDSEISAAIARLRMKISELELYAEKLLRARNQLEYAVSHFNTEVFAVQQHIPPARQMLSATYTKLLTYLVPTGD